MSLLQTFRDGPNASPSNWQERFVNGLAISSLAGFDFAMAYFASRVFSVSLDRALLVVLIATANSIYWRMPRGDFNGTASHD